MKSGDFLPAPSGTTWGEIGIVITEESHICIKVKGKSKKYTPEKFKEIIPQEKIADLLLKIIHRGGQFDKTDFNVDERNCYPNLKNDISRLRNRLKQIFGIETNPIMWTRSGYQTLFSATSNLRYR